MNNEKEGLRFQVVESENFMGIENTLIEIGGRSFIVSGRNEVGKSRTFNLLLSGIDSKNMPPEIITTGEDKAYTKTVLAGEINGVYQEYTIEMFYTPKNRSGRIKLTDKDGNDVKSPKEILKGLIGNLSFDMFKFLDDSKANKIKILKEVSGVRVDIDKLDLKRKGLFDERTKLNAVIERDEVLMKNHGYTPEEIDKYTEPVDIKPIEDELTGISKKIENWNYVKNGANEAKKEYKVTIPAETAKRSKTINENLAKIKALEEENDRLTKEIEEFHPKYTAAREKRYNGLTWLRKNKQPNATEISTRLSDANLHNKHHEYVKQYGEKQRQLIKDKQKAIELTASIEKCDTDKDKLISSSKLPVKGLSFTDEEITYKGLPLEDKQINTATLYNIGFEISKALNPTLKVIFIRAASLFDSAHLKNVITKARKEGYQVIAEKVTDDDKLDIKFIEADA